MKTNKDIKNNHKDGALYLLTYKAMPEILVKVLDAKNMIDKRGYSVSDATKLIGISRTTYYKYCNEVYNFNDNNDTGIVKLEIINIDKVGVLSKITNFISKNRFNILEIMQNNPINDTTKIDVTLIKTDDNCNISKLVNDIKKIQYIKSVIIKSID